MAKSKCKKYDEIYANYEQEFRDYLNRRSKRLFLQDVCRPVLMYTTRDWAVENKVNPRQLCAQVHDQINLKLQGLTSKEIRRLLEIGDRELIRDFFDTGSLNWYSLINVAAANLIKRGVDPLSAVNQACEFCLLPDYVPCPVTKQISIRLQGLAITKRINKMKQQTTGIQLDLFKEVS